MDALNKLIEGLCTGLHRLLARYAGGFIGFVWRVSGKVPLRLRMALGFLLMAAVTWWSGYFISGQFVEWAQFSKENRRVLAEHGLSAAPVVEAAAADEGGKDGAQPADEATSETTGESSVEATGGETEATASDETPAAAEPAVPAWRAIYRPDAGEIGNFWIFADAIAALCVLAALFALFGFGFSYRIMELAYAAWLFGLYGAMRLVFTAPAVLYTVDYKLFDKLSRNAIWTAALGVFSPVFVFALVMLLAMALSTVRRAYGIAKDDSVGDRILRGFQTGGDDPRYRTSWYWAIGLMVFVIVAPFIFRGCGWEDPYGLVQGSGTPELQVVKVKKIKKEKKKKKYILNKWSPYILERARIDDNKNLEELEEFTQDTYVADQPAKQGGKLGKGGGKTGGWPKGMADAKVRFIRLEYAGGDWDQDMGKGSDYNLLIKFNKITGFPIWKETESKAISRLSKFPKHYAPPFVFLTGSRGMNISNSEIQELRKYLVDEGGMLFIDNGGGHFGGAVRSLVQRLFPDKPFIDIPNDDQIYQQPFVFPDGAPPFWHHDGTRAKGVRIGERLAVFYHPGDINDAWKDGHSGASEAVAEQAFRLGINVMYYAFNAYYARHFEGAAADRK